MILYPPKNTRKYTVGGKAKGLLHLIEAGITVPDFLMIPAENFDTTIHTSDDIESTYDKLLNFQLSNDDNEKLRKILLHWWQDNPAVIVRSSIVDEDGMHESFAGIMASFSNLKRFEDVVKAIAACAASAYSVRAIAYRKQKGLSPAARPAVIVQQQIDADVSGVVFSTNPPYPQEMAIHAVWGLGEGLVNGDLDADEFYLLKNNGAVNRHKLAAKDRMITPKKDKGTQTIAVTKDKQHTPCLTENLLKQLFNIATLLEQKFNHPQDIEFVVSKNILFIVQCRSITQPIAQIVVYDNSNIQESYCGVTTPLTFSFAQRAYATVYTQTMAILSLPPKIIQAYQPVVNNLLSLIKGRIYYNINNWYRGLQLLPSFKQNKEDMERMMGVEEPVDFITDTSKSLIARVKLLPSLAVNLLKLLSAFMRLPKSIAVFHQQFQHHYESFYRQLSELTDASQILEQKEILDKELLQRWTTPIINDFYVMMMNGRVRRKLAKIGIAKPDEFLSNYFSGNQQIASAQPAIVMQQLAEKVKQQPWLQELITMLPDDIHSMVQKQAPAFYAAIENYINSYGDRTIGELKLETITMRLSPKIFYSYLRNFVTSNTTLQTAAQQQLNEAARNELDKHLQKFSKRYRQSVYNNLNKLQKAIQYREAMRLERTRLFGMYRSLYLTAGRELCTKGILKSARDIFYLQEDEIESLLLEKPLEAAKLAEERKATFEQYKREEVPARVVIPSPPVNPESATANNDVLQGTGCVAGNVTAEVIVISSPEDDLNVNGKIICALRTDPGWVALFPACVGVLIEKGSALSHSVILLREFGIPAIINIAGLTKKLTTGQIVTMDGGTGEIRIVEE